LLQSFQTVKLCAERVVSEASYHRNYRGQDSFLTCVSPKRRTPSECMTWCTARFGLFREDSCHDRIASASPWVDGQHFPFPGAVVTENSVRSENTGVPIIREIMVATTMSSLFVALFALVASSFRTRAALQTEILALRHQLAVFQKNAPRRLRIHRCDRLLWVVL